MNYRLQIPDHIPKNQAYAAYILETHDGDILELTRGFLIYNNHVVVCTFEDVPEGWLIPQSEET